MISPVLQRILGIGLVVSLVVAIIGIVTLAALGKQQPVELLGLPAALIVAISTGQLFLGHQQVTTANAATTAATIQGLTNALAGVSVGMPAQTEKPANVDAPATPPAGGQTVPAMTSGGASSGMPSTGGPLASTPTAHP